MKTSSDINPDGAFRDVMASLHAYADSGKYMDSARVTVKNGLETSRVLYDLNWIKEIRSESLNSIAPDHDNGVGLFAGYILSVDRSYSMWSGPDIELWFSSEKGRLSDKWKPKVTPRKHV